VAQGILSSVFVARLLAEAMFGAVVAPVLYYLQAFGMSFQVKE
jgi:hypothetical protein